MFHIPKEETRAIVECALLLLVVALVVIGVKDCSRGGDSLDQTVSPIEQKALSDLEKQIKEDSLKHQSTYKGAHLAAQLFPFDPNHADSATLCRLGLSEWQVSNMMKYRRRGGKWRSPDDFHRLYGLSEEDFQRLKPYVRIAQADRGGRYVPFEYENYGTPKGEKPAYEKQEKLAEGTTLLLDEADTTQLKQIPGIGSYYAQKIVKYRERLGGFVSVSQLSEVEGLPAGVSRWFKLSGQTAVKQIPINKASFKELVRHPYLSYEQTKAIVNHIRQYGPIHSWKELRLYKEFTDDDFHRLAPYFSFKEN